MRYDELTDQIRTLEERATNTAAKIKAVNVRGGGPYDGFAETAAEIADARASLGDTARACDRRMAEIIRTIEQVPLEMEKVILTKRYISGKSWETICQDTGYAKTSVYRLHGWALSAVRCLLEQQDAGEEIYNDPATLEVPQN